MVIHHVSQMATSLGWNVSVLATDPLAQDFYVRNDIAIVHVDGIHRSINPALDIAGLIKVYRHLRASRYDVVHTHTSKGGMIGRLAANLARVPVIVHTVHGFPFHEESSRLQLTAYAMMERSAATCCHAIVTVSSYHREWAIRLGIAAPSKIIAIQNGISEFRWPSAEARLKTRAALGLIPNQVALICTSRLERQKGIEYLLRATKMLKEKALRSFKLFVVGTGSLQEHLLGLAQSLRVLDCVDFLGFRRDIGELLHASDIFVLPSLWEGMSISLLEALAAEKPILATSIGSNLEVLSGSGAGLVVPPKDPAALTTALAALIDDPNLRAKLALKAGDLFRRDFTLERMREGYRRLYLKLVAERHPALELEGESA